MRPEVGEQLRKDPRVKAVLPVRTHQLTYRERMVFMLAIDADALRGPAADVPLARNLNKFPRLTEPGTALVSENFAALYGVSVGDRITIDGRENDEQLEVIGTVLDYSWNRGTIIVNRAWYRKAYADDQIDLFDVFLKPGHDPQEVVEDLQKESWVHDNLLVVVTRAEGRQLVVDMIRRFYGMLYVQQVVVGLVALMGVISALFIAVLQRRRELGLLRAVGASRSQVLHTVLAEATLMGLLGSVIGFVIGLGLEWYVVRLLLLDEAGWVFPMQVPWEACGVVFGLSVVLATTVGLWPAFHATRMRIPDAIAYE
jgi:putative ABC transport system permease protein